MIMMVVVMVIINCVWDIGGMMLTRNLKDSEKNLFSATLSTADCIWLSGIEFGLHMKAAVCRNIVQTAH